MVVTALRGYAQRLGEHVAAGRGIVLFGPSGTGKDHLLTALAKLAIDEAGFSVKWCNGMDLCGGFRDAMDNHLPESSLISSFVSPDILYVSDPVPPFGTLKEFQVAQLFRIVDGRYRRLRPTWMTINVAKRDEANDRLAVQIVDRLSDGALTALCNWPSHRNSQA
jgi:DNA replication protein DnaC